MLSAKFTCSKMYIVLFNICVKNFIHKSARTAETLTKVTGGYFFTVDPVYVVHHAADPASFQGTSKNCRRRRSRNNFNSQSF